MKTLNRPVDRREDSIKKKLTAAIAMLLVSCIMVVTSTYAWFTLSTAPEVTGIHTNIAGNGNLEIALANKDTWANLNPVTLSGANESVTQTNESWGNLVKIDATNYGTNLLTLSPAALTYTDASKTQLSGNILSVPKYGADGRVESLSDATLSAIYNGSAFAKNAQADYGLRALGISSKMTERQSAFSSSLLAINNNRNLAARSASNALETSGGSLATIAVKIATASDRNATKITVEEVNAIKALLTDLKGSLNYADAGIVAAIKAELASKNGQDSGIDDGAFKLMVAALDSLSVLNTDASKGAVITIKESTDEVTFTYAEDQTKTVTNDNFVRLIKEVRAVNDKLDTAYNIVKDITAETTYGTISGVIDALMNMNGTILVAGEPLKDIKAAIKDPQTGEINTAYAMKLAQNCVIELGENSGVIYDIAVLAGNIKSNIKFDIDAMGIKLSGQEAVITSTFSNPVLKVAADNLAGKEPTSAGSDEANIISDIYGYALDLLFRTNASESKLKLQTTPVDRIYADNNNANTMGAGSTMTFTSTTASFGEEKMISLINNIKIVFVDNTNTVLAHAVLDTSKNADGSKNYVVDNGQIICNIRLVDANGDLVDINNQVLCPLTANAAKGISTIVYLDGETVTNADVANAATSMTATMNLQFSSTATLDPMDYSGLYIPQTGTDTGNQNGNQSGSGEGEGEGQ